MTDETSHIATAATLLDDPYAALNQHLHGDGAGPDRYGKRRVDRMLRDMNVLRQTIRAEGTPAIQDAWDRVEECIDFAYGGCPKCRATHIEGAPR